MLFTSIICAFGTISAASALPRSSRSNYAVKEFHPVPRGWTRVGGAGKSDRVHLSIGLKQQNQGVVEEHLLQVSDPSHSRYGQHLTAAEIEDIIRPSQETQDLVKSWLQEHGIEGVHNSAKDTIHVLIPIEKAEELLQTSYSIFEHEDGSTLARTPEWSLPEHLHEHIDVVQPTNSFFRTKSNYKGGAALHLDTIKYTDSQATARLAQKTSYSGGGAGPISQICNTTFVTPDCKRTLYGTYDYKPQAAGKNKMGHTNYLNETSKRSDIKKALQTFRKDAVSAADTFKITIVANGNNDQGPYNANQLAAGKNLEAVLDSENMLSVGYPTPLEVWETGGSPPFVPDINTPTDTNEPYLVWLDSVLNRADLPQVISTSYGDDEQTVPRSYAERACSGFAQLGARGISLFFSSGDAGVGEDGTCFSNDGKNTTMFLPSFPASCPWVTTVGGTAGFEPEVAVSRFASGAGFSNYFSMPSYQSKTIKAYIKSLKGLHDGLYNKTGRAYPEISAQSNHDAIVWNNTIRTIGGTSASSPTVAAIFALVNDALLAKGKPTLGFLNPWLYSGAGKTFTDILSGSSFGCNTTGFPAQAGWDAVTGFGTPNFSKLVDAALAKKGGSPKGY